MKNVKKKLNDLRVRSFLAPSDLAAESPQVPFGVRCFPAAFAHIRC